MYASPYGCALWGEGLGHLVVEIMGSNPISGMDVCSLSLYVVLFHGEALQQPDYLSKESCNVCQKWMCDGEEGWLLQ